MSENAGHPRATVRTHRIRRIAQLRRRAAPRRERGAGTARAPGRRPGHPALRWLRADARRVAATAGRGRPAPSPFPAPLDPAAGRTRRRRGAADPAGEPRGRARGRRAGQLTPRLAPRWRHRPGGPVRVAVQGDRLLRRRMTMPGADAAETHSGVVFFAGDRAYKLKKPVDLGFLDFSTRERRERACHREVELNRRFSPDVYLGVADVSLASGEPCDHLVVMRRMPAERRLSRLVADGAPVDDALRAIARLLARVHAHSPRREEISAEGTRDALRGRWTDGFEQVRPIHGRVF